MAEFKVNLDTSSLSQFFEKFAKDISDDIQKGVEGLARSAHTYIEEKAQNGLHSFREAYLENLGKPVQLNKYVWEITLNGPATWIELGKPEWDMKGEPGQWGLLKNPDGVVKNGKNAGKHYKIVPMKQGAMPSEIQSGPKKEYQEGIVKQLRSELKKRSIPYRQIEYNNGDKNNPRIGKLHGFSVPDSNAPGRGNTPHLARVGIYQDYERDENSNVLKHENGNPRVKRSITTFRTAIEGDGKWMHPEAKAKNFFEEAAKWAEQEWITKRLPAIIRKYK